MKTTPPPAKYGIAMLIDDNEIDNFINQKIIEATGFAEKILIYKSGVSALEYLKNISADSTLSKSMFPDYIFLDLNLPIIDGFQFMAEFDKLDPKITGKCKVAILTTSLNPADMEAARQNKYIVKLISKPLNEQMLSTL